MSVKQLAIFASWNLLSVDDRYYISGTHYSYLQFASAHFEKVYLVSSVRRSDSSGEQRPIADFDNIEVVPLPAVDSYLGALKNYKFYCKALSYVRDKVDLIYCRVPDPYCWLPVLKYKMPAVMHYVGDTIDATLKNEKWSWLRKRVMICGYLPDYALTLRASGRSRCYTNGPHLRDKLSRYHVAATAVVSSTVSEADIEALPFFDGCRPPRMIYIGYLRYAKGMNLLKALWMKLKVSMPDFRFTVVGDGESTEDLNRFISANGLAENVRMTGRIDDRRQIRDILRKHDLFIFPSLSEGSPRVVIEAMAEGLPVVSTPVGSLPGTFNDGETIRYFGFDDVDAAFSIIEDYCRDTRPFEKMRNRAFEQVSTHFTKERFLSQIYSLE